MARIRVTRRVVGPGALPRDRAAADRREERSAMSVLPGSSRRAEEFDAALRGEAPAENGLGSMVALAAALQALPLGPTPDFRASLRQRLVAVAAVSEPVAPPTATE